MAQRTPLKIVSGLVQQFAAGDTLSTVSPLVWNGSQIEQLQSGDSLAASVSVVYIANAGPAQAKTLSPSLSFTKSVA